MQRNREQAITTLLNSIFSQFRT